MSHILIVEDESIIRKALQKLLERHEFKVSTAGSVSEAQEQFTIPDFDMVISDLRLPGAPGTELIKLASGKPVLIMTSYASLRSAVDSMKMGAVDYIAKPFDHDEMVNSVKRILNKHQENLKSAEKSDTPSGKSTTHATHIIGSCDSMLSLFNKINKVAPTDATVLIHGESGTGKELVARSLHEQSQRATHAMISVNCAAIPETLIESELFGHEKGAFTGATNPRQGLIEAADGGTLFLDEIGELPFEAQARLLRVLQEGEIRRVGAVNSKKVNIRLIAATHRDLKALAKEGKFREDLYYRLNVVELKIPALRERGDDVIEIADALLDKAKSKLGKQKLNFSAQCKKVIKAYQWPGNVRELENAVERAVILSDSSTIPPDLLNIELEDIKTADPEIPNSLLTATTDKETTKKPAQDLSLEDYFQHFVLANQDTMSETELAQKLGISRKCLWERRQRLGIPRAKKTQTS